MPATVLSKDRWSLMACDVSAPSSSRPESISALEMTFKVSLSAFVLTWEASNAKSSSRQEEAVGNFIAQLQFTPEEGGSHGKYPCAALCSSI